MILAELDDVTYDLEVDGEQVRRTLRRRIWQRGAWATVALVYQERGREGSWQPARLVLIRFQRVHDAWRKHAAIALRGSDALALTDTLDGWRDALQPEDGGNGDGEDGDDQDGHRDLPSERSSSRRTPPGRRTD